MRFYLFDWTPYFKRVDATTFITKAQFILAEDLQAETAFEREPVLNHAGNILFHPREPAILDVVRARGAYSGA